jgi:pyrimidine-nucleoside phosphorylase
MIPVELIGKKRRGGELSPDEIYYLVDGYVRGDIPDYQMAAWLMAVCFTGMTDAETLALTRCMVQSGRVVDLSDIPGVKVDKHSTGGVGDKVSILLAPLVASCGVPVPMISGRGLGHTGGTLDKLESIPGFRTDIDIEEYRELVRTVGVVMAGQTGELVPADKKMYALRDVTATVECIPLMAGSIMSKKIAGGVDALVLDVKTGSGAFIRDREGAVELARTLIGIGEGYGKRTIAFITDMNQPLGRAVGNRLEIIECAECLRGRNIEDLCALTLRLAGAMLFLGGKSDSVDAGIRTAKDALRSGKAYQKCIELVRAQGGDPSYIEDPTRFAPARVRTEVCAGESGYVAAIDNRGIGIAALAAGAGRMKVGDAVDPAAGIVVYKKIGDAVGNREPVATVYGSSETRVDDAARRVRAAYTIGVDRQEPPRLVYCMMDAHGYTEYS